MTGALQDRLGEALRAAVAPLGGACRAAGPAHWALALSNGRPAGLAAHAADGWVALEAPWPHSAGLERWAADPWQVVVSGAGLPGGVKAAASGPGGPLVLRADVPLLDGDEALPWRLDAACRAVLEALDEVAEGGGTGREGAAVRPAGSHAAMRGVDLPALLAEAGWPFIERSAGGLAVTLDVPGGFHQAVVEPLPGRAVRAVVPLSAGVARDPVCRTGLGALLLCANAGLRMARAGAREEDGRLETHLEAVTAPGPGACEVAHALSALSVGCRLCAGPARALLEPQIARHYVRVRGWDQVAARKRAAETP